MCYHPHLNELLLAIRGAGADEPQMKYCYQAAGLVVGKSVSGDGSRMTLSVTAEDDVRAGCEVVVPMCRIGRLTFELLYEELRTGDVIEISGQPAISPDGEPVIVADKIAIAAPDKYVAVVRRTQQ